MDHEDNQEELEIPTAAGSTKEKPATALPEKLAELQAALVNADKYTVRVFRESAGGEWALLSTVYKLPDPDEVGKMYGGGRYLLVIQWRTQGVTSGRPNRREIEFTLDNTYTAQAQAERARNMAPQVAAGPNLQEVLGLAERIAAMSRPDTGSAAVVGLVEKLMDRMDRDRERTDARFEKILDALNNRPDGMETYLNMMEKAKAMGLPTLSGPTEPERAPWLEVAELVANNVGKFFEMMTEANKGAAAKARLLMREPMARKVAAQAAALKDPAKRSAMIAHLDKKVGKETTDNILKALEGEVRR